MFDLFQKMYVQIAGALYDIVDKVSDAGRTARHALRDLQNDIAQAEESVADLQAELLLMNDQAAKAAVKAENWARIAEAEAASNNRQGAIEAVQQQVHAEEAAANFSRNAARLDPMLEQMKSRLSDLRQKLMERQHKTAMLDARNKIADAQARAARSLGGVGINPGISFDELEQVVDRKEAKAASLADMVQEKAHLDVGARLAQYTRRDAISSRLQALGITPALDTGKVTSEGEHHA